MPNNFTFILAENPPEKKGRYCKLPEICFAGSPLNYILVNIHFYFTALKQECCNSESQNNGYDNSYTVHREVDTSKPATESRSPEKEKFVAATPPIPRTNPAAAPETIIVPSNHLLLKMIP